MAGEATKGCGTLAAPIQRCPTSQDATARTHRDRRPCRPATAPLTQAAIRSSPPRVTGVGVIVGPAFDARGGQRPRAAEGQLAGQEAGLREGEG